MMMMMMMYEPQIEPLPSCRSATGFKRNLIQDEDRFQSFCNKIFAGWDFCITNENAAKLKRSSLLYELRVSASPLHRSGLLFFVCSLTCLCGDSFSIFWPLQTDLEEERIKQKIADRTRKEKCRIYLIRVILNLFVVAVLAACFYSIYVATIFSQKAQMDDIKVAELCPEQYRGGEVISAFRFLYCPSGTDQTLL